MFKNVKNEEVCKEALKQLGKSKEEVEERVGYLRKWLLLQPHLPHTADDLIVRSFVLGTSSMEQAKQKLDNLYTYRNKYELLQDLDPASSDWDKSCFTAHLPVTCPYPFRILFGQCPNKKEIVEFVAAEALKQLVMMFHDIITEDMILGGHIIIYDMKEFSIQLTLKLSLLLMSQIIFIYQNIMPIKIKAIIFFNCPDIVDNFLKIFIFPFFSEKTRNRTHAYRGGTEELERHVPLKLLPKDYGGNAPSFMEIREQQKEALLKKRDWFLTEGSYRSDESKRPPPSTDEYGVQGTFRKLNVD